MFRVIRKWRTSRRIKLYLAAQEGFKNGDFLTTWRSLAKLAGSTPRELQLSFQIVGMLQRKTTYQLLREALCHQGDL